MRALLICLFILICCMAEANILIVSANGEHVFPTVQAAIDASANTDTVLVYPGRYVENIRFNGKNITLASMELITGSPDYIRTTILDGNQSGSVIMVRDNESQVTIRGFTITNGSGKYNSTYDVTAGGGLLISGMTDQRRAYITNCHITGNNATWGGGIQGGGNITLSGVVITNNVATIGGAMDYHGYSSAYQINFDPQNRCSIYNNFAAYGSDLRLYCSYHVNVYLDKATVMNPGGFFVCYTPFLGIENNMSFDIWQAAIQEVNHDLYVAPWGSDTNSGLAPNDPLKTIFRAVILIASDSTNPKTIHLAEGSYDAQAGGQIFPLGLKSHTKVCGAGKSRTILENYNKSYVIFAHYAANDIEVSNLSMSSRDAQFVSPHCSNISLKNLLITRSADNGTTSKSVNYVISDFSNELQEIGFEDKVINKSKVNLYSTEVSGNVVLENVEFRNLQSDVGDTCLEMQAIADTKVIMKNCIFDKAGTGYHNIDYPFIKINYNHNNNQCTRLRIEVSNCLLSDNSPAAYSGSMLLAALSDTVFVRNCTFVGNYSYGATLAVAGNSVIQNNVFSNPLAGLDIYVNGSGYDPQPCTTLIRYNAFTAAPRISQSSTAYWIWGEGNITVDPMFIGSGFHPYYPTVGSGLIDAGYQDQLYMFPEYDVAGNERLLDGNGDGVARIDIGAYEYQTMPSPQNLSAAACDDHIYLSWDRPALSRGLCGYRIYRNDLAYARVEGADNTYFQDQISESDTLSYFVTALYGDVESAASNTVIIVVNVTDISDATLVPGPMVLETYPNPFTNLLSIGIKGKSLSGSRIEVYNQKGQFVDALQLLDGKATWKPDNSSSGIYFIKLFINNKAVMTRKVLYLK